MRTILIIFLVACVAVFGNVHANDDLEYILTASKIQKVTVGKVTDGQYNVSITLTKPETEAFKRITAENVGRRLLIIHNGKLLVKAIIQDQIDSGIITIGDSYTASEASERVKSLLSD